MSSVLDTKMLRSPPHATRSCPVLNGSHPTWKPKAKNAKPDDLIVRVSSKNWIKPATSMGCIELEENKAKAPGRPFRSLFGCFGFRVRNSHHRASMAEPQGSFGVLPQRRKVRKGRRRVKIIRKHFHLFPPNLATLRLAGGVSDSGRFQLQIICLGHAFKVGISGPWPAQAPDARAAGNSCRDTFPVPDKGVA